MATIVIEDWMIQDAGLNGLELLSFALIHGCTQKGEGCWYGGYERLAERIGAKQRGTINAVNRLIEYGAVEKFDAMIDGKQKKAIRSIWDSAQNAYAKNTDAQNAESTMHKMQSHYAQNAEPSNSKIKDNIKENNIADFPQDVEELYAIYPTRCPKSGRGTDKGRESKKILVRLLKTRSSQEIAAAIRAYLEDCNKTNTFIKNFDTLLHRIERGEVSGDLFQAQQTQTTDWTVEGKKYYESDFEGHEDDLYKLELELIQHVKRGGALRWKNGNFIIAR